VKLEVGIADSTSMDASSIALQGLQQADAQLNTAASKIANPGAAAPNGANADTVDLSKEMVTLTTAQASFEADLATLKTADQIKRRLVDLTG